MADYRSFLGPEESERCLGPVGSGRSPDFGGAPPCLNVARCAAAAPTSPSFTKSRRGPRKYAFAFTFFGKKLADPGGDDFNSLFPNLQSVELVRKNILAADRARAKIASPHDDKDGDGGEVRVLQSKKMAESMSTDELYLALAQRKLAKYSNELAKNVGERGREEAGKIKLALAPWTLPPNMKFNGADAQGNGWCGELDFIKMTVMNLTQYDAVIYYDNDVEVQETSGESLSQLLQCVDRHDLITFASSGTGGALNGGFFSLKPKVKLLSAAVKFAEVATYTAETGWGNSGFAPGHGAFEGFECGQGFWLTLFYHLGSKEVVDAYKNAGWTKSQILEELRPVQLDRCVWNYQHQGNCENMSSQCDKVVAHHKPSFKYYELSEDAKSGRALTDLDRKAIRHGEAGSGDCLKRGIQVLKLQQSAVAGERRSTLVHLNLGKHPATAQATFNVFYFVEKAHESHQFSNTWPLNVESWLLHLRTKTIGPKVVQLNDANVKDYIPDLPNEFDRLPYAQAKSDFVRYAALFFHGGIYVDSDVLFQKPLDSEVLERIVNGGVELFAYESDGQNCMGDDKVRGGAPSFSSNIMGASRGSSYMRRVWEKQKQAVSDHCKTAAEFEAEARICCPAPLSVPGAQMLHDKSGRPITKCHVPWTRLGEGTSHSVSLVPAVEGIAATFRPTAVKAAHVTQFNPEGGRGGASPNDESALAVPKPKMVEAGGGVPPKDGLARTVFKPKKEKRTDRRAAQSGTIAMQIAVSVMVFGVLLLLAASSRAFWRFDDTNWEVVSSKLCNRAQKPASEVACEHKCVFVDAAAGTDGTDASPNNGQNAVTPVKSIQKCVDQAETVGAKASPLVFTHCKLAAGRFSSSAETSVGNSCFTPQTSPLALVENKQDLAISSHDQLTVLDGTVDISARLAWADATIGGLAVRQATVPADCVDGAHVANSIASLVFMGAGIQCADYDRTTGTHRAFSDVPCVLYDPHAMKEQQSRQQADGATADEKVLYPFGSGTTFAKGTAKAFFEAEGGVPADSLMLPFWWYDQATKKLSFIPSRAPTHTVSSQSASLSYAPKPSVRVKDQSRAWPIELKKSNRYVWVEGLNFHGTNCCMKSQPETGQMKQQNIFVLYNYFVHAPPIPTLGTSASVLSANVAVMTTMRTARGAGQRIVIADNAIVFGSTKRAVHYKASNAVVRNNFIYLNGYQLRKNSDGYEYCLQSDGFKDAFEYNTLLYNGHGGGFKHWARGNRVLNNLVIGTGYLGPWKDTASFHIQIDGQFWATVANNFIIGPTEIKSIRLDIKAEPTY
eukprot:g11751.t1